MVEVLVGMEVGEVVNNDSWHVGSRVPGVDRVVVDNPFGSCVGDGSWWPFLFLDSFRFVAFEFFPLCPVSSWRFCCQSLSGQ